MTDDPEHPVDDGRGESNEWVAMQDKIDELVRALADEVERGTRFRVSLKREP